MSRLLQAQGLCVPALRPTTSREVSVRGTTMKVLVLFVVTVVALCGAKKHHHKYPIKIDDGGLMVPNVLDDKNGERTEPIGTRELTVRIYSKDGVATTQEQCRKYPYIRLTVCQANTRAYTNPR